MYTLKYILIYDHIIYIIVQDGNYDRSTNTQTVKCDFNGEWDYDPIICEPLTCNEVIWPQLICI